MSKISAALCIDSTRKGDNCESTLKYGDDDVSSKRRKDAAYGDEYNTVFTMRLPSSTTSSQLNSTSHDIDADRRDTCCSDDFFGGPVDENTPNVSTSADDSNALSDDEFNVSITTLPSNSSFGFENTFSVLECQLSLSKQPKLNQQQIEYILMKNNDTAVKNPIYIDFPISDEWFLRAISGQANGSLQATTIDPINVDAGPPSLFDLEIEAMLRVKELLANNDTATTDTVDAATSAPMVVEANAHTPINTSLIEDFYQQDGGDYSEYVYHVAKSKDGRLYLRVVRSLLVDKGNNLNFFFLCANFDRIELSENCGYSVEEWTTPIFLTYCSSRWHRFNCVIRIYWQPEHNTLSCCFDHVEYVLYLKEEWKNSREKLVLNAAARSKWIESK